MTWRYRNCIMYPSITCNLELIGMRRVFGGDIQFVLGSIPNGAGTMVLRCF